MAEERWKDFIEWARRARAKPSFDFEEREYRLAAAAAVRDLIEAADEGRPLADLARTVAKRVMDSRYTMLPARQLAQLTSWAEQDEGGLTRALRAFAGAGDEPEARLDAFLADVETGLAADRLPAGLLVGSLLNFAMSPEQLPVVRPARYARLQELLGEDSGAARTALEDYRRNLGFARRIEAALRSADVPVRDMIDVDGLVRICATQEDLWAGAGDAADSRRTSEPDAYLAVCMIYRNEADYLAEWIEFHLLVGVERFFLYDNESDDEHRDVLQPYLEEGIVSLHEWPGSSRTGLELNAVQMGAYEHCISTRGAEARWIAVIDADEFLFSPTGRPVAEMLTEYERWPAVAVNTRRFGPAGHAAGSEELVICRHTSLLDAWEGKLVKSIVDPAAVTGCTNSHTFECRRGITVDENGYPVYRHTTQSPSFRRLQINHYFARSKAELRSKHGRRITDRGSYAPAISASGELQPEHATGVQDDAILQFVPSLREALRRRAAVPS